MAGHSDRDGPPKRSALDQLPLKQRVIAEQRGFIVPERASPDDPDEGIPTTDERRVRTIGVVVVLVIALGLVIAVVALGAAVR